MTLTKELEKILDERHGEKCFGQDKMDIEMDHNWCVDKQFETERMIYRCIICLKHGPVKIEVLPEA